MSACIAFCSVLLVFVSPLAFATENPERWYDAKEIHFTITGTFDGRYILDSSGDTPFTDQIEIDFVTTADSQLVGEVPIRNFSSEISDIKASEPGRNPPRTARAHGVLHRQGLRVHELQCGDGSICRA
ncbi:MAG: hypothetical protein SH820_04915 [Xanthomonadales bacterium]|nr:hypothetical protein [Xanthomonadales bacterium]